MLQEVTSAQAARDDLAIYYFDGRFAHVGRLVSPGRLLSKWGTGHLYKPFALRLARVKRGRDLRV